MSPQPIPSPLHSVYAVCVEGKPTLCSWSAPVLPQPLGEALLSTCQGWSGCGCLLHGSRLPALNTRGLRVSVAAQWRIERQIQALPLQGLRGESLPAPAVSWCRLPHGYPGTGALSSPSTVPVVQRSLLFSVLSDVSCLCRLRHSLEMDLKVCRWLWVSHYISAHTKDCPKHKICTEKNEDCHHMQCSKCNMTFAGYV